MMYQVKKIIRHDEEISFPKCMYKLRKIYTFDQPTESLEEIDINIGKQVIKFLQKQYSSPTVKDNIVTKTEREVFIYLSTKPWSVIVRSQAPAPTKDMAELEKRQDQLLSKLDLLYDKIKSISQICQVHQVKVQKTSALITPDEIVLTASPDNLPWFINIISSKISSQANFKWHIHSSVPTEKVAKVKAFVNTLPTSGDSKVTVRLIFKCADSELKLSSLAVPIVGNVNILRYLALAYPFAIPYDENDYALDGLLDLCHILERTNEKNKEAVVKNIFALYSNGWIYKSSFSILDVAAYNVIKQWCNCPKYVTKEWFDKMCKLK